VWEPERARPAARVEIGFDEEGALYRACMSGAGRFRWRLRSISEADFEWAFDLHRDALGEYVNETWGWEDGLQRRMFSERFNRQRQVIEVDGERVGVLEVEDRPDELYLALLELSPSWQGKGLGTDILHWLMARAKQSNKPLALHVLRTNPRARSFYEREGMRVVDAEPVKFLLRTTSERD
jgi:GNAT superfamily N-acetyltransferase